MSITYKYTVWVEAEHADEVMSAVNALEGVIETEFEDSFSM